MNQIVQKMKLNVGLATSMFGSNIRRNCCSAAISIGFQPPLSVNMQCKSANYSLNVHRNHHSITTGHPVSSLNVKCSNLRNLYTSMVRNLAQDGRIKSENIESLVDSQRSLLLAVKEELKFIDASEQSNYEITFPGNWAIQKLGAKVTMRKKISDKPATDIQVSFSVNSKNYEDDLEEVEGEEDQEQSMDEMGGDEVSMESPSADETTPTVPSEIKIEIIKENKRMIIHASIDQDGPSVNTLAFDRPRSNKKSVTDKTKVDEYETYEVEFAILADQTQEALFEYLKEMGLTEEFFRELEEWAMMYEHSLYVAFLNEFKSFSQ